MTRSNVSYDSRKRGRAMKPVLNGHGFSQLNIYTKHEILETIIFVRIFRKLNARFIVSVKENFVCICFYQIR